jgi:hypothetical protein
VTRTFTHPDGFTFRVKLGSWLNLFTGSDGVTIGRTIHFRRGYVPRARLLSHETRHLQQIRALGAFAFLWRYLVIPSFRHHMEDEAVRWADAHWLDEWLRAVVADLKARA